MNLSASVGHLTYLPGVLVCALTTDVRAARAQQLLERGCLINVQILNEFANVARRKLRMSWMELTDALEDIRTLCPTIASVTIDTHSAGLERAQRRDVRIDAQCERLLFPLKR